MPCYNAGRDVIAAVQSVRSAPFNIPNEIILIDDASTDKVTRQALAELEANPSNMTPLRIIRQTENRGQATARNIGLQMAQYDYILPLDADDLLTPEAGSYANFAVETLGNNPDVAIAYGRCRFFGAREGLFLLPPFDAKRIVVDNLIPVFAMYRRDQVLALGGYSEELRYCEDWDLWLKLLNNSEVRGVKPQAAQWNGGVPYLYRQHAHTDNVSRQWRMATEDLLGRFTEKYTPLYDAQIGTHDLTDVIAYRKSLSNPLRELWLRAVNTPNVGEFTSFVLKEIQARLHIN